LPVTFTADPTVLHPAPEHEAGGLACGPKTLKVIEPPATGVEVAPERLAEGVTPVFIVVFEGAVTVMLLGLWTMAVGDFALSDPFHADDAMAGTLVYCHEPAPGTSEQLTTEAAIEQLPLMGLPEVDPAAYRLTSYAVRGVPPLDETCAKVIVTLGFEAGVTLAVGVAPAGRVCALAAA